MSLSKLLAEPLAKLLAEPLGKVTGLTCDSRSVRAGDLFAAFEGSRHQGLDFVSEAFAKGARAFLVSQGKEKPTTLPDNIPWIQHPNPRKRFAELACALYPQKPETIVAVTGTNGKSSSIAFLRQLWHAQGLGSATLGTLGATLGATLGVEEETSHQPLALGLTTPDAVQLHSTLETLKKNQITHLALEASSHGLEQYRLDGLQFDAAIFTNFSQDHLDYHKTMQNYRAAKLRLFTDLLKDFAVVALPLAEPLATDIERVISKSCRLVKTHSAQHDDPRAHLSAYNPSPQGAGLHLQLRRAEQTQPISLPFQEAFQVQNWLGALAISFELAQNPEQHWASLANLTPFLTTPQGRMERFALSNIEAEVFVDYAHTPHALETVLESVRARSAGRVLCVFGCGGERDRAKRFEMGRIASRLADDVIVTDDNPRGEDPAEIRRAISAACPNAREIGDRKRAIETAIGELRSGDVLLVAGKGHERGQIVLGKTLPFDDREVVRVALLREAR